jgi:hypothetical protein
MGMCSTLQKRQTKNLPEQIVAIVALGAACVGAVTLLSCALSVRALKVDRISIIGSNMIMGK